MTDPATAVPTGLRVLRRMGYFLAVIWLSVGISLILLVLVDGVLKAAFKGEKAQKVEAGIPAIARAAMPAVADQAGYWLEHERARELQWRSYVYFRRAPFAGEYIQVDAHGFRRTVQRPDAQGSLWLFGGSTVWGTGVDDAHTLASKLANVSGMYVGNFGESGYVSTQSQLSFFAALRCAGPAPDAAIFVDGVNDVYAALQAQRAGIPQNESNRVAEFNLTRSAKAAGNALLARLEGFQRAQHYWSAVEKSDPRTLAQAIADNYLAVVAQSRAVANAHGIPALFVWQPNLFERANPTPDERSVIANSEAQHYALQRASTQALKQRLAQQPQDDVVILTDVFDTDQRPLYFDYSHTGSAGNELLAAALWTKISPRVKAKTSPMPNTRCVDLPK